MTQLGAGALHPGGRSTRLWRALASLAAPPEDESGELVATSARAENLVVEFDEAYTGFFEGSDHLPSESQLLALQAVDTKLAAMVRAKDAELWTVRGFREDSSWSEVRVLAEAAIGEFSWPRALD
jgi:hypothetical protein